VDNTSPPLHQFWEPAPSPWQVHGHRTQQIRSWISIFPPPSFPFPEVFEVESLVPSKRTLPVSGPPPDRVCPAWVQLLRTVSLLPLFEICHGVGSLDFCPVFLSPAAITLLLLHRNINLFLLQADCKFVFFSDNPFSLSRGVRRNRVSLVSNFLSPPPSDPTL